LQTDITINPQTYEKVYLFDLKDFRRIGGNYHCAADVGFLLYQLECGTAALTDVCYKSAA
jgi:hypothetical protein